LVEQVESRRPALAGASGRLAFRREHLAGQLAEILNHCAAEGGSLAPSEDESGSDADVVSAEAHVGECKSVV
jgi:hypothetical protein